MAAPTKAEYRIHRQFLRRQTVYENLYSRRIQALLASQYRDAAAAYPASITIDPKSYDSIIRGIYNTCLVSEAEQAWQQYVAPLSGDTKDFFDDFASIFGPLANAGERISLWRTIAQQWLDVNILTKITSIADTTRKAIAKVIERSIVAGLGQEQIAKEIEKEANGEVNRSRARLIARTETISALNKGRRVSMYSSGLEWNKKWVDTPDERTRLSHRLVANQAYRPLDENYTLVTVDGGTEQAQCPGDPQLSPGNICNCRCSETFEVRRDAAGRPIRKGQLQTGDLLQSIM